MGKKSRSVTDKVSVRRRDLKMANVAGQYEFIKPGSLEKSTQTLDLNEDGTVNYTEVGNTSMESWTSVGHGTWSVEGDNVRVHLAELKKEMKFNKASLVPGIEDGSNVRQNVTIPITVKELQNAPKGFGAQKWRRR